MVVVGRVRRREIRGRGRRVVEGGEREIVRARTALAVCVEAYSED